jgi:uncharacterized RmlC-like cupin family protein
MKRSWIVVALFVLVLAAPAFADDATPPPAQPDNAAQGTMQAAMQHVVMNAKSLKWMDGPDGLPKGAKMTVLAGDPGAATIFTVRLQVPAGYKVMPHFHPTDENITVISGDFGIGSGDKFETKGPTLAAGDFTSMPAQMHHFAWTKKGAVIQIHGMGPFQITYINPSDDPRATAAAK